MVLEFPIAKVVLQNDSSSIPPDQGASEVEAAQPKAFRQCVPYMYTWIRGKVTNPVCHFSRIGALWYSSRQAATTTWQAFTNLWRLPISRD